MYNSNSHNTDSQVRMASSKAVIKKPSIKVPYRGKFENKQRDIELMKMKPDRDEITLWVKECAFADGAWVLGSVQTHETLDDLAAFINEDAINDDKATHQILTLRWSTMAGKPIKKHTQIQKLIDSGIIHYGAQVVLKKKK